MKYLLIFLVSFNLYAAAVRHTLIVEDAATDQFIVEIGDTGSDARTIIFDSRLDGPITPTLKSKIGGLDRVINVVSFDQSKKNAFDARVQAKIDAKDAKLADKASRKVDVDGDCNAVWAAMAVATQNKCYAAIRAQIAELLK